MAETAEQAATTISSIDSKLTKLNAEVASLNDERDRLTILFRGGFNDLRKRLLDEANQSNDDDPSFDIGLTTVDEGLVDYDFKIIPSQEGNIVIDSILFSQSDRPQNWLFKQFYGVFIGQALRLHQEADRDAIELFNALCTHKLRFKSHNLGIVVLWTMFANEILEGTDWGGGVRTQRDMLAEALRDGLIWDERQEMRLRMERAGVLQ